MLNRTGYWSIKEFVLVKEVGSGAASTVYYAICRKSTQPVAIKMYLKAKLSKLNRRQVEREINIHSSLNHPHIIDFYAAFEDDERIYLVQEYAAGGDLFDDVKRRGGRVPEREVVQQVLHPYLMALAYLHARGIIHRDIKPENTVFTRERVMKVTDFGLAIHASTERPVTRLGTLDYMAPEVLRCPDKHAPDDNKDRVDLEYDASVDAWAMGVLAYELIVGRPPFGMSCREATMRAIVGASPSIPDWMSPAAADFIRSALQRTAARRAPVAQLLEHPWIVSNTRPAGMPLPRGMPCSAEAAAAAARGTPFRGAVAAAAVAAGGSPNCAASAGPPGLASGSSARSLFYHPGGPYQHLFAALPTSNSASASELGGAAGQPHVSIGAAAAGAALPPYGSDQRPAKRQVQRCQSAHMDSAAEGGARGMLAAAAMQQQQQQPSQQQHQAQQRMYDGHQYWMTDGNGFSYDPLEGLGSGAGGGDGAPVQSVGVQQQQQQQLQRAQAAAVLARTASGRILAQQQAQVQQQQQYEHQQQQQQQYEQQQQQQYEQQQRYQQQQQQQQQAQQQQQQVGRIYLQQQQQLVQQQWDSHTAAVAAAAGFPGARPHSHTQTHTQSILTMSAPGEDSSSLAAGGPAVLSPSGSDPPLPPLTAADYYRLHLTDLRSMWDGGGRAHGQGSRSPSRALSRSFTARAIGRPGSAADGGGGPAESLLAPPLPQEEAAAAVAAVVAGGGSRRGSPAPAARLLLRREGSSSGSGSMKRRTPDTHDWDLPALPAGQAAGMPPQPLQLQLLGPAGQAGAGAQPGSPLGRSSSDAFAAGGGAAAFFSSGGDPAAACVSPFHALAGGGGAGYGGYGGGATAAAPLAVQLGGSSFGSHGRRPSRLSKAIKRTDSLDPGDAPPLSAGASDDSGCSAGAGGGGGAGAGFTLPSPLARCSAGGAAAFALPSPLARGASAAMAAFDQLTLAPAYGAGPGGLCSTADSGDETTCFGAAAMIMDGGATAVSVGGRTGAGVAAAGGYPIGGYPSGSSLSNGSTLLGGMHSASSQGCYWTGPSGDGGGGGGGGSVAANVRPPSANASGSYYQPAAAAGLRLSLPLMPSGLGQAQGGPTACSSSGVAEAVRSHPLSSPQVTPWATPWSTPLNSPGASRLPPRHHLQHHPHGAQQQHPHAQQAAGLHGTQHGGGGGGGGGGAGRAPPRSTPSFNLLLEMMEAEGVLCAADLTPPEGTAAASAVAAAAVALLGGGGGHGDSGTASCSLDEREWLVRAGGGGGGEGGGRGEMAWFDVPAPHEHTAMQLDGEEDVLESLQQQYPQHHHQQHSHQQQQEHQHQQHQHHQSQQHPYQHLQHVLQHHQQQQQHNHHRFVASAVMEPTAAAGMPYGGGWQPPAATAAGSTPTLQQKPQDDRWASAWAAAAAAASTGAAGTTPPSTPPAVAAGLPAPSHGPSPLSRAPSLNAAGAAAAAPAASSGSGGAATHAPSPLGRDQPQQQARAAAMQQHMRTRSLNRFQVEQIQQATAAGAAAAPAPGVPYAVSLQAAGMSGMPYAVSLQAAGGGGGGGGGAVGNNAGGNDGAVAAAAAAACAPASAFHGTGPGADSTGGGAVFGNRASPHAPAASSRPPPVYAGHSLAAGRPYGSIAQQHGHPPYGYHPHYGGGGGGGSSYSSGCAPAVPSPLGLRSSSANRPSTGSGSSDASNSSLVATPQGGADGRIQQR